MVSAYAAQGWRPGPVGDQFQRIREDWVLREKENEILQRLDELVFSWHCSTAQLVEWDKNGEMFNFNFQKSKELYASIGKTIMPWYDGWKQAESKTKTAWERFKQESEDPRVQEESRKTRKWLERLGEEATQAQKSEDAMRLAVSKGGKKKRAK